MHKFFLLDLQGKISKPHALACLGSLILSRARAVELLHENKGFRAAFF